MAEQQLVDWAGADRPGMRAGIAPEMAVRMVGALLALAIAAVHVADQRGISSFASPDWIGWSYRLIEIGALVTAVTLLIPWSAWVGWAAAVLLGTGPFVAYVVSRSVGLPGDHGDVGDWGYWVGTVSLAVEAALIVLGVTLLVAYRQRSGQRLVVGRLGPAGWASSASSAARGPRPAGIPRPGVPRARISRRDSTPGQPPRHRPGRCRAGRLLGVDRVARVHRQGHRAGQPAAAQPHLRRRRGPWLPGQLHGQRAGPRAARIDRVRRPRPHEPVLLHGAGRTDPPSGPLLLTDGADARRRGGLQPGHRAAGPGRKPRRAHPGQPGHRVPGELRAHLPDRDPRRRRDGGSAAQRRSGPAQRGPRAVRVPGLARPRPGRLRRGQPEEEGLPAVPAGRAAGRPAGARRRPGRGRPGAGGHDDRPRLRGLPADLAGLVRGGRDRRGVRG